MVLLVELPEELVLPELEEPVPAVLTGTAVAVGTGVGVTPMGVALGVVEPVLPLTVSTLFMKSVNQSLFAWAASSVPGVAEGSTVAVVAGSSAAVTAWVRSPL